MPYDEGLVERIRDELIGEPHLTEQKMFGGLGFMVGAQMAVAAGSTGELIVRADPDLAESWVDGVAVRPMEMRGRPVRGWVLVDLGAVVDDANLAEWVTRGVSYARSLPPKTD
ncbi:MAG: methyltransferase [Nocardioides sp.]|jgi:hypothetical protein|uniref:TfoX/Sxy family protein n=1 Tax=Nocardioides sp. TaxID=35761 RepID=UPI002632CB79|nr:TfoX/Sxy family protein [Nocardioides sp.]MCW2832978.1 methyltransferase [Nocardioides sp.]